MKRKGFTLVELLAAILIIGIVALISVPIFNSTVKNSKKSTFQQNAVNILKMVHIERNNDGKTNDSDIVEEYIISSADNAVYFNGEKISTDYDGKIDGDGVVSIDSDERTAILYSNSEWCAYKFFDDTDVKIIDGNCDSIMTNCNNPEIIINPENKWSQYKVVSTNFIRGICGSVKYSLNGENYEEYRGQVEIRTNNTNFSLKTIKNDNSEIIRTAQITNIDTTAPTNVSASVSIDNSTLTIVGYASDLESGISAYAFSLDDGKTWSSYQETNTYTITNPENKTYMIRVKAYNGTYNSIGAQESLGASISDAVITTIPSCPLPTFSVTPAANIWTQKKIVTIDYHNSNNSECVGSYSIDGGVTWQTGNSVIFTGEGNISAKTEKNANNKNINNLSIINVDNTKPNYVNFSYSRTTNSITIIPTAIDSESGIWGYEYYLDNELRGTSSDPTFTFTNLSTNVKDTYDVKIVAINNAYQNTPSEDKNKLIGSLESETKSIKLLVCPAPTFKVEPSGSEWVPSRTVHIQYGNVNGCIGSYKKDDGQWTSGDTVVFTANGHLDAKNTDGTNEVHAISSIEIINVDSVPPTFTSLSVESPLTGSYPQGEKIRIAATFSENVYTSDKQLLSTDISQAPNLSIKIGSGSVINVPKKSVSGNKIIYEYQTTKDDLGVVSLVSFSGTIYDRAANNLTVTTPTSVGGLPITIEKNIQIATSGNSKVVISSPKLPSGGDWVFEYAIDGTDFYPATNPQELSPIASTTIYARYRQTGTNSTSLPVVTCETEYQFISGDTRTVMLDDFIGKFVTNFVSNNGYSRWRIFGVYDGAVWLIPEYYIPTSQINNNCSEYWSSFEGVALDTDCFHIVNNYVIKNNTMCDGSCLSYGFTKQAVWSRLIDNTFTDYIQGAAQGDLFISSYNSVEHTPGYRQKFEQLGIIATTSPTSDKIDPNDYKNNNDGSNYGLWAIDSQTNASAYFLYDYYGGSHYAIWNDGHMAPTDTDASRENSGYSPNPVGIRPVVKLKNNTKFTKHVDENDIITYTIELTNESAKPTVDFTMSHAGSIVTSGSNVYGEVTVVATCNNPLNNGIKKYNIEVYDGETLKTSTNNSTITFDASTFTTNNINISATCTTATGINSDSKTAILYKVAPPAPTIDYTITYGGLTIPSGSTVNGTVTINAVCNNPYGYNTRAFNIEIYDGTTLKSNSSTSTATLDSRTFTSNNINISATCTSTTGVTSVPKTATLVKGAEAETTTCEIIQGRCAPLCNNEKSIYITNCNNLCGNDPNYPECSDCSSFGETQRISCMSTCMSSLGEDYNLSCTIGGSSSSDEATCSQIISTCSVNCSNAGSSCYSACSAAGASNCSSCSNAVYSCLNSCVKYRARASEIECEYSVSSGGSDSCGADAMERCQQHEAGQSCWNVSESPDGSQHVEYGGSVECRCLDGSVVPVCN